MCKSLSTLCNFCRYNEQTVRRILLKTLMALPRSDFMLAKCLLDSNRVDPLKAGSTCSPEMSQVMEESGSIKATGEGKKDRLRCERDPVQSDYVRGLIELKY